MINLTKSQLKIIDDNDGMILEHALIIRFDKANPRPRKQCKKLLRELGYEVAARSGGKYYPYIDYVRPQEADVV